MESQQYSYRFLSGVEYPILAGVFEACGFGPMPDPKLSAIVVAQDADGVIRGFFAMQLVPHAEPLWIDPDHRGKLYAGMLIEKIEECAKNLGCKVLVTTESKNGHSNRFAEINEMKRVAGAVYVKEL